MTNKENRGLHFLTDVLLPLHTDKQTGVLRAEKDEEEVKVFIKKGKILYAMGSQKKMLLGYLLKSKKLLTVEQLQMCLSIAKEKKQPLGKILIEKGLVSEKMLQKIINYQVETIIHHLLLWGKANYEFKVTRYNLTGMVLNPLNIIKIMLQASHRIDEISFLKKRIPGNHIILSKTDVHCDEKDFGLNDCELRIHRLVNDNRSVGQLITECGHDERSAYKALHALMVAGLVAAHEKNQYVEKIEIRGLGLKQKIVENAGDLPPRLEVVLKAQEIISNPTSNFRDIVKVIETDQAIAAKVLKLANSAYYGLSGEVSSMQHATVVLGYKALGELVTVAGLSHILDKKLKGYGLSSGKLWQHSLAVAVGAKIIIAAKNPKFANDAFSAGLFHDAGKLVLSPYVSERKIDFEQILDKGRNTFLDAEKQIFGFDHSDIGYELFRRWKLPENLNMAVKYHHCPSASQSNDLAYAVHVADSIACTERKVSKTGGSPIRSEEGALEFLGFEEKDLKGLGKEIDESVQKITAHMHTI